MSLFSRSFPASVSTQADQQRPSGLPFPLRLTLAVAGAGLALLLVISACLRPENRGYGTHQQLGLPPCTFMTLFGRPCPSCGMTTSWARLMHAQPLRAVQTNAGGALLAIVALVSAPWMLASSVTGRWFWARPSDNLIVIVAVAIVAVTLLDWTRRLLAW